MTAPTTVGQRLKAERERRGIGRVAVTRATGIYVHDLAALEFGRFEDLPDNAIETWVRAYARHVGLDGDALVAELRRERGIPEPPPPPSPGESRPSLSTAPRRSRAPLAVGLVVSSAAVIVVAVWWGGRGESPVVVPAPPAVKSAPAPPPVEDPVPPPPPAAPKRVAPPSALSVAEHGVGSGVVDHRLAGKSEVFQAGTEVWFFTDVRGGEAGETVRHVWLRDGRVVQRVSLTLRGARWRTQSSIVLPQGAGGEWRVEARDGAGQVLASDAFRCVP